MNCMDSSDARRLGFGSDVAAMEKARRDAQVRLAKLMGRPKPACADSACRHEYKEMERWMIDEFLRLVNTGTCDRHALYPLHAIGLDVDALVGELEDV
jgi:hypothetical protein